MGGALPVTSQKPLSFPKCRIISFYVNGSRSDFAKQTWKADYINLIMRGERVLENDTSNYQILENQACDEGTGSLVLLEEGTTVLPLSQRIPKRFGKRITRYFAASLNLGRDFIISF